MSKPKGLGVGGSRLWDQVSELHALDPVQCVQLEEACRAKDRLDSLDRLLRGDVATWVSITEESGAVPSKVIVDSALDKANTTANLMKQLLAALRLPDEASGKRPQQRGGARGAYAKQGKGAKVSSLDAARRRAGA